MKASKCKCCVCGKQADGVCETFQGRMSIAYGLIERVRKPVEFYFEKLKNNNR